MMTLDAAHKLPALGSTARQDLTLHCAMCGGVCVGVSHARYPDPHSFPLLGWCGSQQRGRSLPRVVSIPFVALALRLACQRPQQRQ